MIFRGFTVQWWYARSARRSAQPHASTWLPMTDGPTLLGRFFKLKVMLPGADYNPSKDELEFAAAAAAAAAKVA